MKHHPHHDIIIEYLEGKDIEVSYDEGITYHDLGKITESSYIPAFDKSNLYRVKPKEVVSETNIIYNANNDTHLTTTNCYGYIHNLRLYWVDDKLTKAEVV